MALTELRELVGYGDGGGERMGDPMLVTSAGGG